MCRRWRHDEKCDGSRNAAERGWMTITEIILLAAGGIIFILSFLIPDGRDKNRNGKSQLMAGEEVRMLVGREMDAVREHVDDVVNEAVAYAMEKTERSLERLSNEKIMAINEYSDTVLSEIHRNHEEAMFLYDMLNTKHTNLKDTVSKVTKTVKEAEETVNTFHKLAPEPVVPAPVFSQASSSDSKQPVLKTSKISSSAHSAPKAAFVREAEEEMAMKASADNPLVMMDEKTSSKKKISEGGNSNERILQLYQGGMSLVSIAKKLGLGVGEVKLVIDLFNSGNQGR